MELHLTPKPGLVDLADSGSHRDLSIPIMEQSIAYLADYLDEIVDSLGRNEPFSRQKQIAIRAERRLFDELGTNTHKGFIFLGGMLLIAQWHAGSCDERSVRTSLSRLSTEFFASSPAAPTHGQRVREEFKAGGIVRESIAGFPSLFEEGLPAYRGALKQHGCHTVASFAMMARLMQTVEDTTTLHRAGPAGLARVRRDGLELERAIASGDNCITSLRELNRVYVRLNITIGGVADMLGLAYGVLIANGEIPDRHRPWYKGERIHEMVIGVALDCVAA